jgi:nucleoside-diphosphate-sugar epimerase
VGLDLARTAVDLLERADELAPLEEVHLEGHAVTSQELMAAIRSALGDPARRVRRFPWWTLRLVEPFSATARAVRSLRYLWQQPVLLDNAKLQRLLGREPRTPLEQAIRATLDREQAARTTGILGSPDPARP